MCLPYIAVLVFLATQSDSPLVLMRKVLSHHLFVSAFDLLCSHKARLLSSLCSRSGSHLQVVSAAWQVPESATQDDVAEEPVKSPEACGQLWTHSYHLVSRYILDLFWGIVGGREGKLRSVCPFLTLEVLKDSKDSKDSKDTDDRGSFTNRAMSGRNCHWTTSLVQL